MAAAPLVRIGELARRVGLPASTLRAWERRYRIVAPARTEGGYRLYSDEDERRLRAMLDLVTRGSAPAEAAARVLAGPETERQDEPSQERPERLEPAGAEGLCDELFERLGSFDEEGAQRLLDRAVASFTTEALVLEIVLPVLRRTGEAWHEGRLGVGQEHFTSNLIRGRLTALARGWGSGRGPLALLACPPGEQHDLGLLCLGLLLSAKGWRVAFLGADTPLETLRETSERLRPEQVVLPVTTPAVAERLAAAGPLRVSAPLAIGGACADQRLAEALGAELMQVDIGTAAERIAATVPGR